jgi:hypothetical protein
MGQNTADNVVVDFQAEGLGQLLSDPGKATARIAALELADGLDQILGGTLRFRLALGMRGVKEPEFTFLEYAMKAHQGRGFEDNGSTEEPARINKQRPEPQEQPVGRAEVGCSPARSPQDQKVLFEQ